MVVGGPSAMPAAEDRLRQRGLEHAVFSELSQGDGKTNRDCMLGADQVYSEKFPRIEAAADAFILQTAEVGSIDTSYHAAMAFTIRGQGVTKVVPPRIADDSATRVSSLSVSAHKDSGLLEPLRKACPLLWRGCLKPGPPAAQQHC